MVGSFIGGMFAALVIVFLCYMAWVVGVVHVCKQIDAKQRVVIYSCKIVER
jgi:hypothetical protein